MRAMTMGTSVSDMPSTCQCESGCVFHNREAATRRPVAMTTVGMPRRNVVENRINEQKKGKKQTVHHPSAGSVSTVKKVWTASSLRRTRVGRPIGGTPTLDARLSGVENAQT